MDTAHDYSQYTRFNVVGSSGSGKSTVGRLIADALGLKYVEIDSIFWRENWTEAPENEFLVDLRNALSGDSWIVDGNYSRTVPVKWKNVEVVVWLDLPYALILYQVISRTLKRSLTGEELWAGNRENLTKAFLQKDSVILWSMTHLGMIRRRYASAKDDPAYRHIRFVRLRSRKQVRNFINGLSKEPSALLGSSEVGPD